MTSAVQPWASDHSRTAGAQARQLWDRVRSAAPAAAYGLRLWTAVCLALYVGFWLELDNAYWAGLTAAIVCQPSLGASLRKALFYVVGTAIGAVAIVALTACFPQDRVAFCRPRAMERGVWFRVLGVTELRGLCGGAGWLHRGDRRGR